MRFSISPPLHVNVVVDRLRVPQSGLVTMKRRLGPASSRSAFMITRRGRSQVTAGVFGLAEEALLVACLLECFAPPGPSTTRYAVPAQDCGRCRKCNLLRVFRNQFINRQRQKTAVAADDNPGIGPCLPNPLDQQFGDRPRVLRRVDVGRPQQSHQQKPAAGIRTTAGSSSGDNSRDRTARPAGRGSDRQWRRSPTRSPRAAPRAPG